jgi:hypothetical protein
MSGARLAKRNVSRDRGQNGLVKFGHDAKVSISETYILSNFIRLWQCHFFLVNDLYSFDKEYHDEQTKGAVLVNAIDILQKSRSLSTEAAKVFTRSIIWDFEQQMHQGSISLEKVGIINNEQRKLVRGLLECAAGNLFYSAVQGRYGGESAALC